MKYEPCSPEAIIVERQRQKDAEWEAEQIVRRREREEEAAGLIASPLLWSQIRYEASQAMIRLAAKDYARGSLPQTVITGFRLRRRWNGKQYDEPITKQISLWVLACRPYKDVRDWEDDRDPWIYLGSDQQIYCAGRFIQHNGDGGIRPKKGWSIYQYELPYLMLEKHNVHREVAELTLERLRKL